MHSKYMMSDAIALLKERRNAKGLTQEQLAALIGVDRTTITKIENGSARPSVNNAKKIAQALDFDWTIFFNINDNQTSETA
ncbi:helix-turn-helix transcriptional regulator [Mahella australiensis]|uniref:Helix-turn-helix domain protein n=1 Tax=Mahella australiensis (strain DSM 15567 / CIP 107919 / 50-1 BON) TaxID=697281 RepID=F3ZVU7_MAHA5|nr:helix-turn-helix domain-containing protein [Mahella australiensis]AEE95321.1 helix-turn-helix domain protein [Mahella australiensis 50-1 BON]